MKVSRFNVDISILVRAIRRIIDAGETARTIAEVNRNEIRKDDDHTQYWKDEQFGIIRDDENKAYRMMGAKVGPLFEKLWAKIDAARNDVDIYDDRLQTALHTLEALGKNTPPRVVEQLPAQFRCNAGALALLKATYDKYGFDVSTIEAYEKPFTSLGLEREAVLEFTAFATSELTDASWRPGLINGMLSEYEKAFGLNLRVNPVADAIQQFETNTTDAMAAARARRFLKFWGQELEADNREVMEKGINALENDFKGPTG